MKTKLIRCSICHTWHSPIAHNGHCYACGTAVVYCKHKRYTIDVNHPTRPGITIETGVYSWRPSGSSFAD